MLQRRASGDTDYRTGEGSLSDMTVSVIVPGDVEALQLRSLIRDEAKRVAPQDLRFKE